MDEPHILSDNMGNRARQIATVTMEIERLRDEMAKLAKGFDFRWGEQHGGCDYLSWLDKREEISELESKLEKLKLEEDKASGAESR